MIPRLAATRLRPARRDLITDPQEQIEQATAIKSGARALAAMMLAAEQAPGSAAYMYWSIQAAAHKHEAVERAGWDRRCSVDAIKQQLLPGVTP